MNTDQVTSPLGS